MQACLARWTQQDDLVVGVPSLGRPRPELEQVIGYFVNMLPMRSQLSASTTFLQVSSPFKKLTPIILPSVKKYGNWGGARMWVLVALRGKQARAKQCRFCWPVAGKTLLAFGRHSSC